MIHAFADADQKDARLVRLAPEAVDRALEGVRGEVVEYAKTLPWGTRTTGLRSADQVRALIDAEHIGADEVKDRVAELATLALESHRLGRPECGSLRLLLSGPPGVGKSTLARAVADSMGLAFEKIPLGGMADAYPLLGAHHLYDQASPGRVLEAVRRSGVENPLILLDEIDRMGASNHLGDPSAVIMAAIDPVLSRDWRDSYLGAPWDLSPVSWIATCNDASALSPALLDRLERVDIPGYSEAERLRILQEVLLPRAIAAHPFADGVCVELDADAQVQLATVYEPGPGVRRLQSNLTRVMRRAVMAQADGSTHIRVSAENLTEWLTPPRPPGTVGFRHGDGHPTKGK